MILSLMSISNGCSSTYNKNKFKQITLNKHNNINQYQEFHKPIWPRITDNFQLHEAQQHARVQQTINRYHKKTHHFQQLSQYSRPYLFHIVQTLEQHNLPGELAFLPMVESAFKPLAKSNKNCSGLWQIGKATGKRFGLQQDKWIDTRLDIIASTSAATQYLKFLYKRFNSDWLLAIAAYNCGEGTVLKAINKNKQLGKPTDYWSLPLPQQTKEFVPKLLAFAFIIKNHNQYGINLAPITNKPYFTIVHLESPTKLHEIAKNSGIKIHDLMKLNPEYKLHHTHPEGPHKILIPEYELVKFTKSIAANQEQQQKIKS